MWGPPQACPKVHSPEGGNYGLSAAETLGDVTSALPTFCSDEQDRASRARLGRAGCCHEYSCAPSAHRSGSHGGQLERRVGPCGGGTARVWTNDEVSSPSNTWARSYWFKSQTSSVLVLHFPGKSRNSLIHFPTLYPVGGRGGCWSILGCRKISGEATGILTKSID